MGPIKRPTPNARITRHELLARLDSATTFPVTVIAAPAGSGKTALMRSWAETRAPGVLCAWVSTERAEADEQRFWTSVIDELRSVLPVGVLAALSPTPAFDADVLVRRLANDLRDLAESVTLVIDDVHEIADADLQDRLGWLLERLPGTVRLVLLSRRDLQLGLHRLRMEGHLAELRMADLRFTLAETHELVLARGIVLSEGSVQRLYKLTEGWAAGLQLAMVALAGRDDPEEFVAEFSGSERTVAEYLIAEVLDTLPSEERRLLLRASVVDQVNGELGNALSGGLSAAKHLHLLATRGAFVMEVESKPGWYRFHRLFADFLALELRRTEPEAVSSLHLTAAQWFANHGSAIHAIEHAQAGEEHQLAASLLLENYFSLTLDGRRASAHTLLTKYVLDVRDNPPEIAVVIANDELTTGSLDRVATYLALADSEVDRVPPERRSRFDLAMLLTRLTLARRLGDFRSVIDQVTPQLAFPSARSTSEITVNNDVETLITMNVGIVEVWSGQLTAGIGHLREARELARITGRPWLEVGCLGHLAHAAGWSSFQEARRLSREAIALAESHGWGDDSVIAPPLIALGIGLIQAGRIAEGEEQLSRAARVIRPDVEPEAAYTLQMAYATGHFARGDHTTAISKLEESARLAQRLVSESKLGLQLRAGILFGRVNLGQSAQVRHEMVTLSAADLDAGEMREVAAAAALADGRPQEALAAVQPLLTGAVAVRHPMILVRALLFSAHAQLTLGCPRQAAEAVERALDVRAGDVVYAGMRLSGGWPASAEWPRRVL